jgi:hypothetical protein
MLDAINELTSKQGGFDGSHGKTEIDGTQEGEAAGEEDEARCGGACQQPRDQGQGGKARSCQAQNGSEEESGAEAEGRNESGGAACASARSASTGSCAGRGCAASRSTATATPGTTAATIATKAGSATGARAYGAADAWLVAHAAEAAGELAAGAEAAGIDLERIGLGRHVGHLTETTRERHPRRAPPKGRGAHIPVCG